MYNLSNYKVENKNKKILINNIMYKINLKYFLGN